MSLAKRTELDLFNAETMLPDLLPEKDPMLVFASEIYPLFSDKDFEDCYSTKGRAAISPAFLSLVTILQWKENLSDVEARDACVRRLDWKIALHLPIDWKDAFDPSTLCRFRSRLLSNDKISLLFDKILGLCQERGFIKKN